MNRLLKVTAAILLTCACRHVSSDVSSAVVSDGKLHYVLSAGSAEGTIDVEQLNDTAFNYFQVSTALHLNSNAYERLRRSASDRIIAIKKIAGLELGVFGTELREAYPNDAVLIRLREQMDQVASDRVKLEEQQKQIKVTQTDLTLVATFSALEIKALIFPSEAAKKEINTVAKDILFMGEQLEANSNWEQQFDYIINAKPFVRSNIHLINTKSTPALLDIIMKKINSK